jgi:hypothetical protein
MNETQEIIESFKLVDELTLENEKTSGEIEDLTYQISMLTLEIMELLAYYKERKKEMNLF